MGKTIPRDNSKTVYVPQHIRSRASPVSSRGSGEKVKGTNFKNISLRKVGEDRPSVATQEVGRPS